MIDAPAWIIAIADSWLARTVNNSTWIFAIIEAGHLLGLVVFGGAVLAVDLGILGMGFRQVEVGQLERQAQPWMLGGLILMVTSGVLMFWSEPIKCYFNPAFRAKMIAFVLLALVLTILRRQAVRARAIPTDIPARPVPMSLKTLAALSLALWLAVGVGGRAIGFY